LGLTLHTAISGEGASPVLRPLPLGMHHCPSFLQLPVFCSFPEKPRKKWIHNIQKVFSPETALKLTEANNRLSRHRSSYTEVRLSVHTDDFINEALSQALHSQVLQEYIITM